MIPEKRIITFIGIVLGMSNSMIMQTLLSAALPTISREFQNTVLYSWVYSGYILASTITIPIFGKLCDHFGNRQNYLAGGIIFFIGTLWCGMCTGMAQLVAARVIMGIGAGIVIPASYGIIGQLYEKDKLKKLFAVFAIVQIASNGLGSLMGGYFTYYASWRLGVFILIPIELTGFAIVFFTFRNSLPISGDKGLNAAGGIIFGASLLMIMIGIGKAGESIYHKVILISGFVLLLFFIIYDFRKPDGILPKELKTNRTLKALILQVFLMGAVFNICLVYLPAYMQADMGRSTGESGIWLLLFVLAVGAGSLAGGIIKTIPERLVGFGWTLITAGGIIFVVFTVFIPAAVIAVTLMGTGLGFLSSVLLGHTVAQAEDSRAGVGSIAHLVRNMGGSIGVAAFQFSVTGGSQGMLWGVSLISFAGLVLMYGAAYIHSLKG